MAGRHVELREIDYAEVLRERRHGSEAGLDQVIANCLQGDAFDLDEEAARALLEAAGNADKLGELILELDASATRGGRGLGQRAAALIRLLQGIIETVSSRAPDQLEPAMQNVAAAIGRLSPEMMVSLLSHRGGAAPGAPGTVDTVVSHMWMVRSPASSRAMRSPMASVDRVAGHFTDLVQDADHRPSVW